MVDSISENFSELMYDAGEKKSVVITHTTKAHPEINGFNKTSDKDQDYRHGNRAVLHKGEVILKTRKRGRILYSDYKTLLK